MQALIRSQGGPGGGAASDHSISFVPSSAPPPSSSVLSPSLNAVADVAVSSALLAIVVQLVPEWGAGSSRVCFGSEDMP